ncbi:MAG: helicase-related protein [Myxococcota bacterium]
MPSIAALLGPTNTGKTHRAVARMLEHPTGMIGLPLRLLAREVYDRITPQVGENAVALVTGEEKRLPPRPRYWVCTVESMPVAREVAFLAVDEIQLCGHPQRGHVFTERLLHARGTEETWFLGASTMRDLVSELVPAAQIRRHPRLSTLRAAAPASLRTLPKRSAVVAFSAGEVYALAERIRERRGGAAVVMGALSPRTRNAQVAMYQAGEVDFLVATDAVGMGLNLDVDHVAFAAVRKFDGFESRALTPAELGQVAGRAGRYTRNGTFGVLQPLSLPIALMRAVEGHHFAPQRRVMWRNADLDLSSVAALSESLDARSPRRALVPVVGASDREALSLMAQQEEVRTRARDEEAVRLLWDVCRIPDFRRLMAEHHVTLLRELFVQIYDDGRIEPDFMHQRIARLEQDRGDIDTLLMRMESIRTWNYVAHHGAWVRDPLAWQERTAAAEDRLSEALHRRLIERFVATRGKHRRRGNRGRRQKGPAPPQGVPPPEPEAEVVGPFAALAGLRARLPEDDGAPEREDDDLVDEVVAAPHERILGDGRGQVWLARRDHCVCLARLTPGTDVMHPEVKLQLDRPVGAGGQQRLRRRLRAWVRDTVESLRGVLPEPRSPGLRGLRYLLEQRLGTVARPEAHDALAALEDEERQTLRDELWFGRRHLYVRALLQPEPLRLRSMLVAARWGRRFAASGERCLPLPVQVDDATLEAAGYGRVGQHAVRVDVLDRVLRRLDRAANARRGPHFDLPPEVAKWLRVSLDTAEAVVIALGYPREAEGFVVPRRPSRRGTRQRASRPSRKSRPRRGTPSSSSSSSSPDE